MLLDKTKMSKSTKETFNEIIKEEGLWVFNSDSITVKIQKQKIIKVSLIFSLSIFKGGLSTVQAVAASNFIYFYTFHGLKKVVASANQSALKDLLFSCCAGT